MDPAFDKIPKDSTCFRIWRIEKLQVVAVPRDQYGSFYSGDSYIIYSATEPKQTGGMDLKEAPARARLQQHIHFWLGASTTVDEAGTAAIKTVELDEGLGGAPVQHREAEGAESARFLAYFPNGMKILVGGVASGFNHFTNEFAPKLFCIKGLKRPVLRQVPTVGWSEMNPGDVFILQTKEAIFVWQGQTSNGFEKMQAAKVALDLKNTSSHCSKAVITVVEDGTEGDLSPTELALFTAHLPLAKRGSMKSASAADDKTAQVKYSGEMKLYHCSDDSGSLQVKQVKTGLLAQGDLNSGDSYIIDNGPNGIWVWIGKKASPTERKEGMKNAQGFIKDKKYPNTTQVTRVIDGGEPEEFKALFTHWN